VCFSSQKVNSKRILLFTCNDDPHAGNTQLQVGGNTGMYNHTYLLGYLVNQSLCPLGMTPKFFLNEPILGAVTVLSLKLFHESTTRWAKKFFAKLLLTCTLCNFSWWPRNARVGRIISSFLQAIQLDRLMTQLNSGPALFEVCLYLLVDKDSILLQRTPVTNVYMKCIKLSLS